jgi:hypothetical protein
MAHTGHTLGPKESVQYVADNGSTYLLKTSPDLVISNSGAVIGTVGGVAPKGFKPRAVFAQATIGGKIVRKRLICFTTASTLYATSTPQVVTIDGEAFTTTGRLGERQRFI